MPARRLYKFRIVLQEAKSGTETDRVPVSGAVCTALWPGPRVSSPVTIGDGSPGTITVHDSLGARAGDSVYKNNLGETARQLSATVGLGVFTQTQLVVIAGAGAVSYADGDQVVLSRSTNPTMYTDPNGDESVASVTTNAQGEATFYCKAPVIDLSILDGSTYSAAYGIEGESGGEEFWPEEFGAVRQGTGHASPTDDAGAFEALTLFIKHRNGGKIKLGAGTYRLNSVWTISAISNLVIEGAGPGLTILEINHSGVGINITGSMSNVLLRNLELRRVVASSNNMLQIGTSVTRCVIDTVIFNAVGVAGGVGIYDQGTDTRIDRVWMVGSGGWQTGYKSVTASRPRVTSLIIRPEANWTHGIAVDTDTLGARFRDCEVVPLSTQTGIGAIVQQAAAGTNAPRDTIFDGCVFRGGTSNFGMSVTGCRGLTIDNCTLRDSQIGIAVLGGYAIRISDCNIHTIQNEGIRINDSTSTINGVIVTEPIFEGVNITAAGHGHITILGTAAYVFINGMAIGDWLTGATTSAEYAVNIAAGVTEIQVINVRGNDQWLGTGWINNSMTAESVEISHSRFGISGSINYIHSLPTGGGTPASSAGLKIVTSGTTVDVSNIHTVIFNPSAPISFSDFTNPVDGQIITCMNIHASNAVTFTTGANYKTDAGASFVMGQYDTIQFQYENSTGLWLELGRSANA